MTADLRQFRTAAVSLWESDPWRTALIGILSACWVLPQLGDIYLWMDEAETAVLGKNILTYGYPRMFDGRNLMAYYPPLHNADYVEIVLPWLQYYLTAASFYLFGVTTFSARLPFALCGIGAVMVFPFIVRRLTQDRWVQVVAPLLLMNFIPFLLYFRQCRYYGLVILCTLWMIWAYMRLAEGRRWSEAHLVLSSAALFHSHYVVCAGTLIGLGLHWLLVFRSAISWAVIGRTSLGFLGLTVPWILYAQFWTHGYAWFSVHKVINFTGTLSARLCENFSAPLLLCVFGLLLHDRLSRFWQIICICGGLAAAGVTLNLTGFPYLAAACVFVAVGKGLKELWQSNSGSSTHLIWLVPVGVILTLALLSPSNEIRYLVGIAPLAILGLSMALSKIRQSYPTVAVVCLVVFWSTNLFNALPARVLNMLPFTAWDVGLILAESDWARDSGTSDFLPDERVFFHRMSVIDGAIAERSGVRSLPWAYISQLLVGYDGPFEALIAYLATHGTPDDKVKIDYGVVPMIFYTDMLIFPEDRLSDIRADADWIILHTGDFVTPTDDFMKTLEKKYERIILPYPDLLWDNRPELEFHYFSVPENLGYLEIYRKI